jgi:hypothetical protein
VIEFPKIPSTKGFRHNHCVAFVKLDGTNIGAEWTPKRGFHKFRLRSGLFDHTHPTFGPAVEAFKSRYDETLGKVFKDSKLFRTDHRVTVFGEFFGPDTFAGNHYNLPPGAKREVVVFDIYKDEFGFIGPDDFIKLTEGVPTAPLVYRGKFTGQFAEDVRTGKYASKGVVEGVVVKAGKGGDDYEVAKIKTYAYLEELKKRFKQDWEGYWE